MVDGTFDNLTVTGIFNTNKNTWGGPAIQGNGSYIDGWSNIRLQSGFGNWGIFNKNNIPLLKINNDDTPNNAVYTKNNTLDDGSGNMTIGAYGSSIHLFTPTGNPVNITTMDGMGQYPGVLVVQYGLRADDIQANGFISTTSTNIGGWGGGAIMMGHGYGDKVGGKGTDMPVIMLEDTIARGFDKDYTTLWLKKGNSADAQGLLWGDLELGTLTTHGNLYLTGNTNGYLWNNGGYIRQSGGSGFIVDGSLSIGAPRNDYSASAGVYKGPLYLYTVNAGYGGVISIGNSSIRYKEKIQPIQDASWLYNLHPMTFEFKDKAQKGAGRFVGLAAEEVNEQCPMLAWTDEEGKPEGVHYEWLAVPMIVELQKLRMEVDQLKTKHAA